LLAPVLAFTADEAWGYAHPGASVHCEEFPAEQTADSKLIADVDELLRLRGVVGQAIEKARQEKLIGNSLEASVVLHSDSDVTSRISEGELEEFLILSEVKVEKANEPRAEVARTQNKKCARCWRYRPAVGTFKDHPELCERCEAVVAGKSST